ncbi:MAG: 3-deoxy-manno-octulosonate cytidylyltransferase [Desulfuromonas sp.]|nr:MAG: 3-deoxy-manno-octulosonate cytidylyltransferase [Desulfuromonas sp.]
MRVVAIIPARYASTRFPGKPLADIAGRPMIYHVYERTMRASSVGRVIVATDDQRIFSAVEAFGGEAVMTRDDHPTGTDRLAEVAAGLDADLVVNVQGDEPLIDPRMIDQAVAPLIADSSLSMGTLKTAIGDVDEFLNPNVVKVVTELNGCARYFSRAPIPFSRDFAQNLRENFSQVAAYKHVGLYVYQRDFLLCYPTLPETPLEKLECLEQLRALEHGYRIHVEETTLVSHGVDTPEDLARVVALLGETREN